MTIVAYGYGISPGSGGGGGTTLLAGETIVDLLAEPDITLVDDDINVILEEPSITVIVDPDIVIEVEGN